MVKIKEPTLKEIRMLSYYASIDAPYHFLPRKIIDWLETGGLEELKKDKPTLAKWIENMNKEIKFPEDIKFHKEFLKEVEGKMKEKGCLKEGEYVYQSELQSLFRYKYNPLTTKSQKYICMAKVVVELLDEKLKKEPNRKDIAELKKVFEFWLKLNKGADKKKDG